MVYVGKLDVEKYSRILGKISTEDVIITEERIAHIMERHREDYERYAGYISNVIAEPDYIIEANKPHTAVLLKEIREADSRFKLVLRIRIEEDPEEYKNSVISFWRVGETTWQKNLKNKKILYKRV